MFVHIYKRRVEAGRVKGGTMTTATHNHTAFGLARIAECSGPDDPFASPGSKFLLSVQDDVNERIADEGWDDDSAFEVADGAVPVYTGEVWATFVDLCAWQEDPTELGYDGSDMEQAAKVCLFMIAERLAAALGVSA